MFGDDHRAAVVGQRRLRVIRGKCSHCGAVRDWYFRLTSELAS